MMTTVIEIAEICHEANRALQRQRGEIVNFAWENTSQELRNSAIDGVVSALGGRTPEELHMDWVIERESNGWVYGDVKDFAKKTHPCLLPYDELPEDQRAKDRLFHAVVKALGASVE
jgi:hypothetical protein